MTTIAGCGGDAAPRTDRAKQGLFAAEVISDLFVKAVFEPAILESVQAFGVGVGANRDRTETAEAYIPRRCERDPLHPLWPQR
jgi:hypothetical protein